MTQPPAPLRLLAARSAAWAVHTGGWLVLGAVGARYTPLWAGGLLPVALWLGLLACTLQAAGARAPSAGAVRMAWLVAAWLVLMAGAAASPWLLAAAWAAASAAANWTVRLLRGAARSPGLHTLLPAALGVAAAGLFSLPALLGLPDDAALWAGGTGGIGGLGLLTLGVLAAGAALTWGRGPARQACRAGVLDGWQALQGLRGLRGLDPRDWRAAWAGADTPQRLAAAAMLPMMAGLPALLALCTTAGSSGPAVVAAHLAAMVLPGAAASALCRPAALAQRAPALCAGLLVAGGLALPLLPLLAGLMWATLLHTAAWSLAWAAGVQDRAAGAPAGPAPRSVVPGQAASAASAASTATAASAVSAASVGSVAAAALAAAGGVLAVGLALSALGPQALWLAHAALAGLALVWVLARAAGQPGARQRGVVWGGALGLKPRSKTRD